MKLVLLVLTLCKYTLEEEVLIQNVWRPDVQSLHVQSAISYRYAYTSVSSTICNPAEISQDVIFSMVLPENAYVSGFFGEVDGKSFNSHVKEKEAAKRDYMQQNKSVGVSALKARDANRFTVSMNVQPHGQASFNLVYEEVLIRKGGNYKHVIYLDPGQIVKNLSVEVQIEDSNITTLHVPAFKTIDRLNAQSGDRNRLARIELPDAHTATVKFVLNRKQQQQLAANGVKGQFIVEYDVDRTSEHPNQLVVNGDYFAHYFAPEYLERLPKYIIFVLDISSSMIGQKFQHVKKAMDAILKDLCPLDYFSLVTFETIVKVWDPSEHSQWVDVENTISTTSVLPVTADNVRKAKAVVHGLQCFGDRNTHKALDMSAQLMKVARNMKMETTTNDGHNKSIKPLSLIILITDGNPTAGETNLDKIIEDTEDFNRGMGASIISLAIGGDADMDFLSRLSLSNYGFAKRIYIASDMSLQIKQSYLQVATPLLTNIDINYKPEQKIDTNSLTKHQFASFFSGTEIIVAGHIEQVTPNEELSCEVTGHVLDGKMQFKSEQSDVIYRDKPQVEDRLWPCLITRQLLLDEKENHGTDSVEKQEAIDYALKYSFMTPLTSRIVKQPGGREIRVDLERADKALWDECQCCKDWNLSSSSASNTIPALVLIYVLYIIVVKLS